MNLKLELVDDWKRAWRWASVQLAALVALAAGFLTQFPTVLQGLTLYVPERWRPVAAIALALVAFIVPTAARLLRKKPCPEVKPDA